jgi:hypothetical protein
LVEPVRGVLKLKAPTATAVRVRPLSSGGWSTTADLSLKKGADGWELPLGEPVALEYLIEIARGTEASPCP